MTTDPERAGDASDMEFVEDEEENPASEINSQILRRPDLLAALQERIHAQMLEVCGFYLFFSSYKLRY